MGENPASNRAPELKLQVQTASGYTIELDLLTDKALSRFGKSTTDVRSVDWSDHFSDSVYTELGLASSHHPLIGSGSTMLGFQDGKVGEMSDIFYQDYNEARNHFRGLPHWNHERRYSMPDGSIQWDKRLRELTLSTRPIGLKYPLGAPTEPASSRRCLGYRELEETMGP